MMGKHKLLPIEGSLRMNRDTGDGHIPSHSELLEMTAEVVSAYVGNNNLESSRLPGVINTVFSSLSNLGNRGKPRFVQPTERPRAAVPIKRSVTPEYLVCLEDGKKLKMLKRHLRSAYGLTPEEYRAKWGLPADYPMVAPNYAAVRSEYAKKIGLGKNARH